MFYHLKLQMISSRENVLVNTPGKQTEHGNHGNRLANLKSFLGFEFA